MIGGDDHVVQFRDTPVLREYVQRYAKALWPDCVFQTEDDSGFHILYVYKNQAAVDAWIRDGGTDGNQATMFTVYFGDTTTIVTGPNSSIGPELTQNIENHWMHDGFEPT